MCAHPLLSLQLAEALLTLANFTADEHAREELYARAQAEGGDLALELDPPATALPAAISAIAATAAAATATATTATATTATTTTAARTRYSSIS